MRKGQKVNNWTENEIDLLYKKFSLSNWECLLKMFPLHTKKAIARMGSNLKIHRPKDGIELNLPVPDRLMCSYLAGFLDGEGSICIVRSNGKKSPQYGLRLQVANSNMKPLLLFKGFFGGYIQKLNHFESVKKNQERQGIISRKLIYQWGASETIAYHVLTILKDYLVVKCSQCRLAIEFHKRRDSSARLNPRNEKGHILPLQQKELEIREKMRIEMRNLNKGGATK